MAWFRRLFVRKVVAAPENDLEELRKRVQRLEIRQGEQQLSLEAIDEAVYRLGRRANGRLGGRPAAVPDANGSLDSIPHGDKAELRKHYATELAARQRGNIPRD